MTDTTIKLPAVLALVNGSELVEPPPTSFARACTNVGVAAARASSAGSRTVSSAADTKAAMVTRRARGRRATGTVEGISQLLLRAWKDAGGQSLM
jgi:hypothetical protein